jgi:O-acetyl-ADP-ribose deacetylase (regulator of RNase III)
MSGIRLWNGDICDLEVDAIVVPATTTLWMTSGAAAAVKQRGGHGIEFEAIAKGPQPLGSAVATGGGSLGCGAVIHAVSLGPDRRTSVAAIGAATGAALRLAGQMSLHTIALTALGSPLGGVPLAECARVMLHAIHQALPECASLDEVVLALRGERTYATFMEEMGREPALRAVPVVPGANAGPVGAGPVGVMSDAVRQAATESAERPATAPATAAPNGGTRRDPGGRS